MPALLAVLLLTLTDARALVRTGVTENDRAKIIAGVDAYYNISAGNPPPPLIAEPYGQLATAKSGDELARALLGVRFFEEAALVAAPGSDTAKYVAMLQRMRRAVSGNRNPAAVRNALAKELKTLWPWQSYGEAVAKMEQQYGAIVHHTLHGTLIAHKIADQSLLIDQYGHKGTVRFVTLDGVVSSGAKGEIGGFGSAKVIYRVRPGFAETPARQWELVTSGKPLASGEDTVENTGRRMQRQYLERLLAETGSRDAFIARFERDEFHFTMVLHEGRHAIDDALNIKLEPGEMEYRAKLSQVALSESATRLAAADVLTGPKDNSPHGRANAKLVRDLARWMKANAPELGGITHFDRLTDEQIRTAFRSLDPLAKAKR